MLTNERIEWVDISKGIGIILVLIGHISQNMNINKPIYAFHMPLFFIISGFLFYRKDKKTINYKRILIPYFIFSILTFAYWAIVERHIRQQENSIIWQAINIFYGAGGPSNYVFNVPLWFIPCYLVTEVVFKYISMIKKEKNLCIILIICSIIGWIIPQFIDFRLLLGIDTMFTSIFFYGLGYFFSSKYLIIKTKIKKNRYTYYIIISILSIIFAITYNLNIEVDMNNLTFGNYFLYYISAISGSFVIILLAHKIKSKIITWIGKNTMIIMCIHGPIKRMLLVITSKILNIGLDVAREDIWIILENTVILIIILIPIIIVTNKLLNAIFEKIKFTKILETDKINKKS